MKKKFAAVAAFMGATSAALAEGVTTPGLSDVNTAITDIKSAADAYAGVILPYIAYIGLAFIGISVVYLLFKVFKRFVGGK